MTDLTVPSGWYWIIVAAWITGALWLIYCMVRCEHIADRPQKGGEVPGMPPEPRSPGFVCELPLTYLQRWVLMHWLRSDPEVPPALRSLGKQIERTPEGQPVPLYRGQVMPLLNLYERKGAVAMARELWMSCRESQ